MRHKREQLGARTLTSTEKVQRGEQHATQAPLERCLDPRSLPGGANLGLCLQRDAERLINMASL